MGVVRVVLSRVGRLKRCHAATWCAVLLAAVVMTLVIVPAGYERNSFRQWAKPRSWWDRQRQAVYDETQQEIARLARNPDSTGIWLGVSPTLWQHGWPMPYLFRAQPAPALGDYHQMRSEPLLTLGDPIEMCNGQITRFVSWSNYDNWPLDSTAWRIHPGGLVVNSAVWLSVVVSVGWLVEWWLRSRGGLLRFRLGDLLAAVTLVAIGFGWWSYHSQVHRLEARVNEHFVTQTSSRGLYSGQSYVGPTTLAKLAGGEVYLPHFHHTTWAHYSFQTTWRDDLGQIVELPYLGKLRLNGEIPYEALQLLESIDRLDDLSLEFYIPQQLETVERRDDLLRPEALHELSRLRLRELRLASHSILAEDVDRVLAANDLELLTLQNVSMTLDELETLEQRYPEVDFLVRWGTGKKIPPDDITERIADLRQQRAKW